MADIFETVYTTLYYEIKSVMNNDDIELKTLPLHSKTDLSTQTSKALNRKGKAGFGPKSGKVNNKAERGEIIGQVDQSGKSVIGLNSKKVKKVDENMNTSKKTEKKTGLRDWFMGKSTKTQKTKVMQRTDKMMGGPIMERLQKQSAYLSATLQEEQSLEGARSTGSASPDHEQLNYEDFVHKKHLLQFHSRPTFCDVCDDFIWGMYRSAIRCKCKSYPSSGLKLSEVRMINHQYCLICYVYPSAGRR